eukprot:1025574_1
MGACCGCGSGEEEPPRELWDYTNELRPEPEKKWPETEWQLLICCLSVIFSYFVVAYLFSLTHYNTVPVISREQYIDMEWEFSRDSKLSSWLPSWIYSNPGPKVRSKIEYRIYVTEWQNTSDSPTTENNAMQYVTIHEDERKGNLARKIHKTYKRKGNLVKKKNKYIEVTNYKKHLIFKIQENGQFRITIDAFKCEGAGFYNCKRVAGPKRIGVVHVSEDHFEQAGLTKSPFLELPRVVLYGLNVDRELPDED